MYTYIHMNCKLCTGREICEGYRSVEYEGFSLGPDSWVLRNHICTKKGPKVNCVRQVDS